MVEGLVAAAVARVAEDGCYNNGCLGIVVVVERWAGSMMVAEKEAAVAMVARMMAWWDMVVLKMVTVVEMMV
ncbi:hypothetical protein C1H46_043316 [Malus baccata]|uniref:Uncharacterized protein n=1 Tax=Malus baccata TaxID=106549 RepID=A0A540KA98_MALBA|nr:hypothetical protein C1H46_043315 [Malus baccata]TQD71146.1 hypothetical protein C1H46_043316 [Malus baccata]